MKSSHAYYNPNPLKLTDSCDCVLRSYTKAFGITWWEASLVSAFHAISIGRTFDSNEAIEILLEELGCKRHSVRGDKKSTKPTPESLARKKKNKSKVLLCHVENHLVTVAGGKYYDTWDSGEREVIWYYEVTPKALDAMRGRAKDSLVQEAIPVLIARQRKETANY